MNKIFQGNCLDIIKALPDKSVNCCVTSPPYYGLRDYGVSGQLGLEKTPAEYVEKMVEVFREVRRVLRDDGTLWLNLGDSYAGNCSRVSTGRAGYGDEREGIYEKGGDGYKPKDLIGIPWSVAKALQEPEYCCSYCGTVRRLSLWAKWDNGTFLICGSCGKRCGNKQPEKVSDGWYLRQDIIWSKPNPMPESVTDRCTKAHEYIFMMAKSSKYFYDNDAIKEPSVYCDTTRDDKPQDRRIVYKDARSFDGKHTDKQRGHGRRHAGFNDRWDGMSKSEQCGAMRNKRSVWTVATHSFAEAHFATFPEALITPCILAGCPEGGTVMDPFFGAGTTGVVCKKLNRQYIGIELNPKYIEMAERRIRNVDEPLPFKQKHDKLPGILA